MVQTQTQTDRILQQAQKLASDLDSARLHGLTDERLGAINRGAKELQRLVRQG